MIAPSPHRFRRFAIFALAALAACSTPSPRAPVVDRSGAAPKAASAAVEPIRPGDGYTVQRGDTLHAIALEYGLDYRELAQWNRLANPNVIRVGQVLRLTPPPNFVAPADGVVVAPLKSPPPVTDMRSDSDPGAVPPPGRAPDKAPARVAILDPRGDPPPAARIEPKPEEKSDAAPADDRVDWGWPTDGRVIANFDERANLKGVDIGGTLGQPVVATAAGKVIYIGSDLRGYGKLIIIKHNKTYLSAYAHNNEILVKEGQTVMKGQKIAEMGSTDADKVKLHFQIRRLGKPVDPAKFLPGDRT